MPALSGTVFVSYADRTYLTIEKLLKEQGYYTFSMHANNASMWNRQAMYKSMGYDKFYAKESFDVSKDDVIGLGLNDKEFFSQMVPILKDIESKNQKYMGTIITLTNHTPWDGQDAYGDFPLTKKITKVNEKTGEQEQIEDNYLKGTKIGDYIRSVHYADEALGEFINNLYENDLFNNTVLVFYGDHDAKLPAKEYNYLYNYDPALGRLKTKEDEGYIDYDYYANELNRNTPLLIWTKDHKYVKKYSYKMGMIDVLPTIGNMMGFKSKFALGHDIFEIKDDNIITFPNGNFLTKNVYYNNSKNQYKVLKPDIVIDASYIEKCKNYTDELLDISNDIIVYDLIKKEGDNIK
jgi:phosphoglycerol transferase MdoB-like AlkP superfamily enzyme